MKTNYLFPFFCILFFFISACKKPEKGKYESPKIYTLQPLEINNYSAILRGRFIKGTEEVNEFGFEWRKKTDNTYKTIMVQPINDIFFFKVTGLEEDTEYAVRAFVANKDSLWFAEEFVFFTKGTVVDIDGNVYLTMRYGKEIWMTENMRVTRFADGTPIEGRNSGKNDDTDGPVYYYNKEHTPYLYNPNFGLLYNWAAARNAPDCFSIFDTNPFAPKARQGICPDGWHLSSSQEWINLIMLFGGWDNAAVLLKTSNWTDYPHAANNYSQFSVEPSGYYEFGIDPMNIEEDFRGLYASALFWTSEQISDLGLASSARSLYFIQGFTELNYLPRPKSAGLSVRCVKD